jgi:hypothetical protein
LGCVKLQLQKRARPQFVFEARTGFVDDIQVFVSDANRGLVVVVATWYLILDLFGRNLTICHIFHLVAWLGLEILLGFVEGYLRLPFRVH